VRSRGWAEWGVCELRLVDDQAVRGFMRRLLFTRSSSEQQRRRDVSTTLHEARWAWAWAQVVTKVARADPFAVCNLTNLADERLPTFICASPRFEACLYINDTSHFYTSLTLTPITYALAADERI
jgi:hypothetical protein